jgi:hypothetical protein
MILVEKAAVGRIVSERDTPNLKEVRINLSSPVERYEWLWTPLNESESLVLVLRVMDIIRRDPYATAEAMRLQDKLPEGVSIIPGDEVPGKLEIAIAQPIAIYYSSEGKVREPVVPARPRAPVYRLEDADLLYQVLGLGISGRRAMSLGTEIFSRLPLLFDCESLARHCLIVGSTGTGKSWLRGVLMEELASLGIPQIIFDLNAEYIEAAEQLGGLVLVPGNNFHVRLESIPVDIFAETITRVLPTEWQQAVAVWAFRILVEQAESGWPGGKGRLIGAVEEAGDYLSARRDTIAYTKARIDAWLRSMRRVLGRGIDWPALFKKYRIFVIDCSVLTEEETELVVSSTLKILLELRSRRFLPPMVVSLDEAHRFVPRGKKTATSMVLRDFIRRGRQYGIATIIITQYPDSIDGEVMRIPNLKFIFAIEPGYLREIRPLISDLPETFIASLPSMAQGVCVVTGTREVIQRSTLMKVKSERETTHGGATPDLLEETKRFYGESREK